MIKIRKQDFYLFGIALLSSSVCALPFLLGLKYCFYCRSGGDTDDVNEMLESMRSSLFQFSIISTIAICVLIYIDFFFSILTLGKMRNKTGTFAHLVLISSLFFPSIVTLLFAIPEENPLILVLCFQSRLYFVMYAMVSLLMDFGPLVFRSKYTWTAYIFFQLSTCFRTVSLFTTVYHNHCFYSFIACAVLGAISLQILIVNWIRTMSLKPFESLTISDLTCSAYLVLISAASVVVTILYSSLQFPDNRFLSGVTLVGTLFTMAMSIVRSQLVSYEAIVAQKDLVKAKEAIVRYFSHELRNPLNIICMGLDTLKESMDSNVLNENQSEVLAEMRSACSISMEILNELLVCSSQVSGLLSLERTAVSVSSLMESSSAPGQRQAKRAKVQLVELSSEEGSLSSQEKLSTIVRVDVKKYTRAVQGLLAYAIGRSPERGVVSISSSIVANQITSTATGAVAPDDVANSFDKLLRVVIKDQGQGLTQDVLDHLFNDIGNAESSIILCKTVMELHQGSFVATSEGCTTGCTFTLDLPFRSAQSTRGSVIDVAPETSKTNSRSASLPARSSPFIPETRLPSRYSAVHPHGESVGNPSFPLPDTSRDEKNDNLDNEFNDAVRILIVDDSQMNRRLLNRGVCGVYRHIGEAVDGLDAIAKFDEALAEGNPYSVILMDFSMPNMDGPTATALLRENKFYGPIIGVTGNALPRDVDLFIAKGADLVLLKPVSMETVRAAIRDQLITKQRRRLLLSNPARPRQSHASSFFRDSAASVGLARASMSKSFREIPATDDR